MKDQLQQSISQQISNLLGVDSSIIYTLLERPKDASHGDLALPCFALAKRLVQSTGGHISGAKSPVEIARALEANWQEIEGVSQVRALGPFLNISFDRSKFIAWILNNSANQTSTVNNARKAETVIIEYSSPNIAKPFHVGHLRATLIGNCLDRVYSKLGYNVISINHLGDWGTQFGFVWAGCKLWGKPENPTVRTLVELYRKATGLREEQKLTEGAVSATAISSEACSTEQTAYPEVNELARNFFVDLEKGEPYAREFWQWCLDISLAYFKETYQRLGIEFDYYTGESFYSDKLDAIKNELETKGLLIESQGALGIDLGGITTSQEPQATNTEDLGFARVYTPDGRSLYLTRDLATAKYRADTFNFERAIYVVGAPQTLHFKQLKAVLTLMGHTWADKIEHVPFGHVLGMKTRGGGEFVELNQFIEEASQAAEKAYREQVSKRPDNLDESIITERVALAAIIFSNLSKTRLKDVTFSWKHALEFQGDSGPYLLYAYARINGIRGKALDLEIDLPFTDASRTELDFSQIDTSLICEDAAYQLAIKVEGFERALHRTALLNEPNELAEYALDLAKSVSKAYTELKVVGTDAPVARARLALFEAARLRLKESLILLGIEPLERM